MENSLSAELGSPYELLGVKPGVSIAEIKAAYRDLAKVWHPDRFAHDERLQKKAQEKLKEINEAYEQLISAKTPRPQPTSPNVSRSQTNTSRKHVGKSLLLVVVVLLIFGAGFFVTTKALLNRQLREQETAEVVESTQDEPLQSIPMESQKAEHRNRNRTEADSSIPATAAEPEMSQAVVAPPPAMNTVTVLVDPASGLIAKPDCPVKTRLTYPSGSQPTGYCTIAHPPKQQSDADGAEARVKSIAKRVTSPNKWLGGSKEKSTEIEK